MKKKGVGFDLLGVGGRNGSDLVGVDDAAFQEVEVGGFRGVLHFFWSEKIGAAKARPGDIRREAFSLVVEVVDGEENFCAETQGNIHLFIEGGNQGRGPVVNMDDVGPLARFVEVFEAGSGEIDEPVEIVVLSVDGASTKKMARVVGLEEVNFQVLYSGRPDGVVVLVGAIERPEVSEFGFEIVEEGVVNAVVLRKEDVDGVSFSEGLARQAINDVSQTANLGDGGEFGRDVEDVHELGFKRV